MNNTTFIQQLQHTHASLRLVLSLAALMGCMAMQAQVVKVYENNKLVKTYKHTASNAVKVVIDDIPSGDESTLLTQGTFSVSPTKKVRFSKGNLYWDGTEYRLEKSQTEVCTFNTAHHAGSFWWTSATEAQTPGMEPWTSSYSPGRTYSEGDKLFCGESNALTAEGVSGLYALTGGGDGEWAYLLGEYWDLNTPAFTYLGRPNASQLYKKNVTVDDTQHCLVIAPDDFNLNAHSLKDNYTLAEIEALGLVCLPPTTIDKCDGYYLAEGLDFVYTDGVKVYSPEKGNNIRFYENSLSLGSGNRNNFSDYGARLVKNVPKNATETLEQGEDIFGSK